MLLFFLALIFFDPLGRTKINFSICPMTLQNVLTTAFVSQSQKFKQLLTNCLLQECTSKIVIEFRSSSQCISLGWLSLAILLNSTLYCYSSLSATNCLGTFIPMLQPTALSNHNLGVLFHFNLFNLAHLGPML